MQTVAKDSALTDLMEEADKGYDVRRFARTDGNTLNTPFKAGLTSAANGFAIITMSSVNVGTILWMPAGVAKVFVINKVSGVWRDWIDLNPEFKVIYDKNGLILSKSRNMIEVVFMACKQLPTKAEIDSVAGGEKWIAKKSSYNLIWNYSSGAGTSVVLQISNVDGFTAVKDINNDDITAYQLYGRFIYAV